MALQGYRDDLADQVNEVNLVDLFLHTLPQETPPILAHLLQRLLPLFTDMWSLFNHLALQLIQAADKKNY